VFLRTLFVIRKQYFYPTKILKTMPNSTPAGEVITLPEAIIYVNDFRKKFPKEIKASIFDCSLIQKLLDQTNCSQLKIYYGYDDQGSHLAPVLVGIDDEGDDMTAGIILERSGMCPDQCDFASPLMK
jgi:hypothetical protein